MAHAHRTDQCRVCNKVLRTCRCTGPKDIWWTTCSVCLAKSATPQPKTTRVRIAVAVDSRGHWNAAGVSGSGSDELMRAAVLDDEKRLLEVDKVPLETEARFEPSFVFLYQVRPELAPAEKDLEAAVLRYFPAVRWQGEHLFTSCVQTKCALPAYIRFLRDTSTDEVPR